MVFPSLRSSFLCARSPAERLGFQGTRRWQRCRHRNLTSLEEAPQPIGTEATPGLARGPARRPGPPPPARPRFGRAARHQTGDQGSPAGSASGAGRAGAAGGNSDTQASGQPDHCYVRAFGRRGPGNLRLGHALHWAGRESGSLACRVSRLSLGLPESRLCEASESTAAPLGRASPACALFSDSFTVRAPWQRQPPAPQALRTLGPRRKRRSRGRVRKSASGISSLAQLRPFPGQGRSKGKGAWVIFAQGV